MIPEHEAKRLAGLHELRIRVESEAIRNLTEAAS